MGLQPMGQGARSEEAGRKGCASLDRALVLAVDVPGIMPSRRRGGRPGHRSAARRGRGRCRRDSAAGSGAGQPRADDHLRPAAGHDGRPAGHIDRFIGDCHAAPLGTGLAVPFRSSSTQTCEVCKSKGEPQ
jgi:hypothetical protein